MLELSRDVRKSNRNTKTADRDITRADRELKNEVRNVRMGDRDIAADDGETEEIRWEMLEISRDIT